MPFLVPRQPEIEEDLGIITDGLLHRWALDEGSGNQANDTGSEARHSVISNPNWVAPGAPGFANCLEFSNATTYINVGNLFAGAGTALLTLCFWYRPTSASSSRYSFGQDASGINPGDGSIRSRAGGASVEWFSQGAGPNLVAPADITPLNTWTHVIFRADGVERKFFFNGIGSSSVASGALIWNNAFDAFISRDDSFYGQFLGNDFRIYDRSLADQECLDIAQGDG